jgi:hypothetical protein
VLFGLGLERRRPGTPAVGRRGRAQGEDANPEGAGFECVESHHLEPDEAGRLGRHEGVLGLSPSRRAVEEHDGPPFGVHHPHRKIDPLGLGHRLQVLAGGELHREGLSLPTGERAEVGAAAGERNRRPGSRRRLRWVPRRWRGLAGRLPRPLAGDEEQGRDGGRRHHGEAPARETPRFGRRALGDSPHSWNRLDSRRSAG